MNTEPKNSVKYAARTVLIAGTVAIAAGYGAAFLSTPAPAWAPWLLAFGIPASLGGIILLGAARSKSKARALTIPIGFVVLTLVIGFTLALALPANESATSTLWLGFPARAAIVIYGIGILPAIALPLAYAMTFESHTLSAEDVKRVKRMAAERT